MSDLDLTEAAEVERVMREQNVSRTMAQWVAASSRRLRTAIAARGHKANGYNNNN